MARNTYSGLVVEVTTADLLADVTANRAKHRAIFDEAVIEFRKRAITKLDALIKDLNAGKTPDLYVHLPVPEEHTNDYDRAIKMLQLHTGETIELNEQTYTNLVEDSWGWSELFTSNTVGYTSNSYN